jgi:antitoxin component YwqK of YwqJK toxin-antitoxin module
MEKVMSKTEVEKEYYESGNVYCESYYINGKIHREDGPAYIWYYDNGDVAYKGYYIKGELHREDGPAIIRYHENGNVWHEYYYLNGERLNKEELYQRLTVKQRVNLLYGKGNE